MSVTRRFSLAARHRHARLLLLLTLAACRQDAPPAPRTPHGELPPPAAGASARTTDRVSAESTASPSAATRAGVSAESLTTSSAATRAGVSAESRTGSSAAAHAGV